MSKNAELEKAVSRVRREASAARAFFHTWNELNLATGSKELLETMNNPHYVDFFQVCLSGSNRLIFQSLGTIFDKRQGTVDLSKVRKLLLEAGYTDLGDSIVRIFHDHRDTIKGVRHIRNKSVAHLDSQDVSKVFKEANITPNQIQALIDAVCEFLNRVLDEYDYPDGIAEGTRHRRAVHSVLDALRGYGLSNTATDDTSYQYEQARLAHKKGEWKDAEASYERAAEQGHARAQFELGMMYFRGEVDGWDTASACEQAVTWCEEAAANGLDRAKEFLVRDIDAGAQAYRQGDYWEAECEFRRLAAQDDAEAEFRLAHMYLEERISCDFDVDVFENACNYLRDASGHGHARAEYWLHAILAGEYDVANYTVDPVLHVDEAQAQYWKAAERSPECQYLVGLRAEGDVDHAINDEAGFWYRLAADRAHVDAQFRLGLLAFCGLRNYDKEEGAVWLCAAASNGHSVAAALVQGGAADVLEEDSDDSEEDRAPRFADVEPPSPSETTFKHFAAEFQQASKLCKDEPGLLAGLYRTYRATARMAGVDWAQHFSSDAEVEAWYAEPG